MVSDNDRQRSQIQELARGSGAFLGRITDQERLVHSGGRDRALAQVDHGARLLSGLRTIIDAIRREEERLDEARAQRRRAAGAQQVWTLVGSGAAIVIATLILALLFLQGIVEQNFANLIGNAVQYLDPARPGRMEIGSRDVTVAGPTAGLQVYSVKDNGLGIPRADHPRMFTAFTRLHVDVAQGEGIGLALVRRMVERHGGRIWLESAEGIGTTFFLALSACPVQGTEVRLEPDRVPRQARAGPTFEKPP